MPKTTWRRTIAKELSEMHLTWEEAQKAAKDREKWRNLAAALCPIGGAKRTREPPLISYGVFTRDIKVFTLHCRFACFTH